MHGKKKEKPKEPKQKQVTSFSEINHEAKALKKLSEKYTKKEGIYLPFLLYIFNSSC